MKSGLRSLPNYGIASAWPDWLTLRKEMFGAERAVFHTGGPLQWALVQKADGIS
jgi:hypothetical protein